MERISISPRPNWREKVEALGFGFHSMGQGYWNEAAYYRFSLAEIEALEKASNELWACCLEAVDYVIQEGLYARFGIPAFIIPRIERSWEEDEPSIYGRFDFSYDGQSPPKLLEFNADTPTSLFEASVVQWHWLEESFPAQDQFNRIHEALIETWQMLQAYLKPGPLYFACDQDNLEDYTTTEYLRDCAMQAGLDTRSLRLADIGWHTEEEFFTDLEDKPLRNIFKLYPYEWMLHEEFGKNLIYDTEQAFWIEPPWKMLLSNKAILPILWELFPDHPNLLPAYFEQKRLSSYVRKPKLSREGANVLLVEDNRVLAETPGDYGEEGFIYQALHKLPRFAGQHALIGSWLVGQEAVGIGVRESKGLITDNGSWFVPHLF